MDLHNFFQSPWGPVGAMAGTAGLFGLLRAYWSRLFGYARSRVVSTLEIQNTNPVYEAVSVWLDKKQSFRKARALSVAGIRQKGSRFSASSDAPRALPVGDTNSDNEIWFLPAPGGFHRVKWNGRSFGLMREVKERDKNFPLETLRFYHLHPKPTYLRQFVETIVEEMSNDKQMLRVMANVHGSWRTVREAPLKSPDSVILPEGQIEQILTDIRQFISNRELYESLCIPHRRGYLFHGLPGSGKSSLAQVVASELRSRLFFVDVSSIYDDNQLRDLMVNVPQNSVLLFEDIDAAFVKREKSKDSGVGVSLSGLLNALDGVAAQENSVVILTTNFKEQLDAALIRAGRVDFELEFTHASASQVLRLAERLLPNEDVRAEALVDALREQPISMAQAQTLFLKRRECGVQQT